MLAPRPYVSALWEHIPEDIPQRLEKAITCGAEAFAGHGLIPRIFFRADDIGVPSVLFHAMTDAFADNSAPLGLAVVPAWCTSARWEAMQAMMGHTPHLWCWHQHGWRHANHEQQGRKYEFGPSRPASAKKDDIARGKAKLESVLQGAFTPLFTPPWNRVDAETLTILQDMKFTAISRTQGAKPQAPEGLIEIPVNVDLHTRRETTPEEGWAAFLAELTQGIATGVCGIMLHHQRMNGNAVAFLRLLLGHLSENKRVALVHMLQSMP